MCRRGSVIESRNSFLPASWRVLPGSTPSRMDWSCLPLARSTLHQTARPHSDSAKVQRQSQPCAAHQVAQSPPPSPFTTNEQCGTDEYMCTFVIVCQCVCAPGAQDVRPRRLGGRALSKVPTTISAIAPRGAERRGQDETKPYCPARIHKSCPQLTTHAVHALQDLRRLTHSAARWAASQNRPSASTRSRSGAPRTRSQTAAR